MLERYAHRSGYGQRLSLSSRYQFFFCLFTVFCFVRSLCFVFVLGKALERCLKANKLFERKRDLPFYL